MRGYVFWAWKHRREWFIKSMLVPLGMALFLLGELAQASAPAPTEAGEPSLLGYAAMAAASAFIGGLISAAFSMPILLYRTGRAVEQLDNIQDRVNRIEAWRDRHTENHG